MRKLRTLWAQFLGLFTGARAEQALDEEIAAHLDLHIEENLRRGMTLAEARRSALLKLGGRDVVKEAYRDQRRLPLLASLAQDVRFALRTMRRSPGLSAVAILTLALGIGANTAMFSVVYGVVLRPLPYGNPDRLAFVFSTAPSRGQINFGTSAPDFREMRDHNRTWQSLSAFYPAVMNLSGDFRAERLSGAVVSTEFFDTLRVRPLFGRTFTAADGVWGAHRVVVLSEAFWRTRFGGRGDILHTTLLLNGDPHEVVGVMPASFYFFNEDQVWTPMAFRPGDVQDSHNNYFLNMVGRLKPGSNLAPAVSDLDSIMASIAQRQPENKGIGAAAKPLERQIVGDIRRSLWVLLAAVGFILLICCVNLSSLLLSRDAARKTEFALRTALGASRGRLLRQFFTENLLLCLLGGLIAVGLAYLAVAQVRTLTINIPRIHHTGIDPWVLLFALGVSIASALFTGLAPILAGSKSDVNVALRQGGRVQSASASGRARGALIVAEVALAFVLAIGAGLMLRSFGRLLHVDKGFDTHNVLTFNVSLSDDYTQPASPLEFTTPVRVTTFYDSLLGRIDRLPGVVAAGVTSGLPLRSGFWIKYLSLEDRPAPATVDQLPQVQFRAIEGNFFQATGIALRKGRFFDKRDDLSSPPVAIINSALARRYYPNEDPIGKLVLFNPPEQLLPPGSAPPGFRFPRVRIIGVVEDVHFYALNQDPVPEVYGPLGQSDFLPSMSIVVRTRSAPATLIPAIRDELSAIDRSVPMANIATMEDVMGTAVALPRLQTLLLAGFGILAIGLAAIGLYGVIAQSVAQRRHEVGVRMALGARPQTIVASIVARAMTLVAIGLALGCALSFALTRLMTTLLFGVTATDLPTFAAAVGILVATSFLASYLPARRAATIDPIESLRCD